MNGSQAKILKIMCDEERGCSGVNGSQVKSLKTMCDEELFWSEW